MATLNFTPEASDLDGSTKPPERILRSVDRTAAPSTWREVRLPRTPYAAFGKRLFDIVGSIALLVVFSPVFAVAAITLRFRLGPKVLLSQKRVGFHGQTFGMFKFRTMLWTRRECGKPFDGQDRRNSHKSDQDPRHTSIGRLLRKTSIDELPQMINVFRGEMSLVGPRPELDEVVEQYGLRDHPRHAVRPGVTGVWQTSARQEGLLLHESVDIDNEYLEKITFLGDLRIMYRTIAVVLNATGR